jgi:hypothetical protein
MESVIDFKRDVYQKALSELARYLRRRSECRPPALPHENAIGQLSRS